MVEARASTGAAEAGTGGTGATEATGSSTWEEVDRELAGMLVGADRVLEAALVASAVANLPAINVSPLQGKQLYLLARLCNARRVLEIGTLGGYSTTWLGRAVGPDGCVVSLERNPTHAAVARANLANAGLGGVVEVREGPALESLAALGAASVAPFDMVFIDADKPSNPDYLDWALRLTHPGSCIVVDNVVRDGTVIDASSTDATVVATRRLFRMLRDDRRLTATVIQTVGAKGYDGYVLAIVESTDGVAEGSGGGGR